MTKRRMVWRISDIVEAAAPDRRRAAVSACALHRGNVPEILRALNVTLPIVTGTAQRWWDVMDTELRAQALVAVAKRLGVKRVPS